MITTLAQLDPASLAPYMAGPGAAVLVLMAVLGGLYSLVVKHLIPLGSRAIDRHLAQIDSLIATQRDESKGVLRALSAIDKRLARLEGQTDAGQFFTPNAGALSPDRST